jgi:hypothetical protein
MSRPDKLTDRTIPLSVLYRMNSTELLEAVKDGPAFIQGQGRRANGGKPGMGPVLVLMSAEQYEKSQAAENELRQALFWAAVSIASYYESHSVGSCDREVYDLAGLLGYDGPQDWEQVKRWLHARVAAVIAEKETR